MDPDSKPVPRAVRLPVLADLIARGDGTFILKPQVPEEDLDTWVTVRETAEVIGHIKRQTIYRWLNNGYLVYRRPLRSKILVSLTSARALRQATLNPEFWYRPELQAQVQGEVAAAMARLTQGGLPTGER